MSSLIGKRVVVTRPLKKSASLVKHLRKQGADPILLPVIKTQTVSNSDELDDALTNLSRYAWLIITSAEGVEAVWERLAALSINTIPSRLKIAVIGPKTAKALTKKYREPDFMPGEYVAEALLPGLGELAGRKILLARANLARTDLPILIRASGGEVDDLVAYHTLPVDPPPSGLAALQAGVDIISFTSPSTIAFFTDIVSSLGLETTALPGNPIFAYIGPITATKAESLGMSLDVVAEDYTAEGIVEAIQRHYENTVTARV